jgi:CBS domain-containing protein
MDVREVMTDKVVSVAESTPLDRVVHLMETHRIKRLPVLRGGKIVGIVSRANLMRALASVHRGDRSASKNDAVTRNRILTEIEGQGWSVGANVDVVVRSGVADIWGSVADPAQRDALKVLVERTPGVKGTVDHLSWEGDVTPT